MQDQSTLPSRSATPRKRHTLAELLWRKVNRDGPNGCWIWTGAVTRWGYGHIRSGGKDYQAHRAAWELTYGPIDAGLLVCHKCEAWCAPGDRSYRRCVNPAHLYLGTNTDNLREASRNRRWQRQYDPIAAAQMRGGRNGNARLTIEQVREVRRRFADGQQKRAIGKAMSIDETHVGRIVSGTAWKGID